MMRGQIIVGPVATACGRGLLVAGIVLLFAAFEARAVDITLSEAMQPGDYFVSGGVGSSSQFYQVRPSNSPGSQVLYSSGVIAESVTAGVGGAFNHDTGDLFYWSGTDGTYSGYELREIKAGQTTSSLVIGDMRASTTVSIYAAAVASDNTVYAYQSNGQIRKFTPDGLGGYNSGTLLGTATDGAAAGATLRIINSATTKDQYLLIASAQSPGHVDAMNTTTGAKTTVTGAMNTGSFNRAEGIAVDYNNLNGDGTLRVLLTNISAMSTLDNTSGTESRRITEVAFNPITGVLSNPFSGGTGNLSPDNPYATGVVKLGGTTIMDMAQFDNSGDLVAIARYAAGVKSFTAAQLYPENASLLLGSGTTTWSSPTNFTAVRALDIAPVPEPAAVVLVLMGLGGAVICYRKLRRS